MNGDSFESGKDSTDSAQVSRKPPEITLPVSSIVESAEAFISGNPNGEQEAETEFGAKFQEAIKKANPEGHSTLDAMKK